MLKRSEPLIYFVQCLRQDLCPTESNHDGTQGDNNKKKRRGRRPPTSPSQKQFMKLKLAHDSLIRGRQVSSN